MASTLTSYQRDILTRTILGEALNEGSAGQAAVANVIKNRAESGSYPSDPAAVALQPNQFSAWNSLNNGGNNVVHLSASDPRYADAQAVVDSVFSGDTPDNTGGALNYYAPAGMNGKTPSWAVGQPTTQIGTQLFLNRYPVEQTASTQPVQIEVRGGNEDSPGLNSLTGAMYGVPNAPALVQTASGSYIAPGVYNQGDHSVTVSNDGNGNAVIQRNYAPGAIPGVTGGLAEKDAPTLVGDYLRSSGLAGLASVASNLPSVDAGTALDAANALGSGIANTGLAQSVSSSPFGQGLAGLSSYVATSPFLGGLFGGNHSSGGLASLGGEYGGLGSSTPSYTDTFTSGLSQLPSAYDTLAFGGGLASLPAISSAGLNLGMAVPDASAFTTDLNAVAPTQVVKAPIIKAAPKPAPIVIPAQPVGTSYLQAQGQNTSGMSDPVVANNFNQALYRNSGGGHFGV